MISIVITYTSFLIEKVTLLYCHRLIWSKINNNKIDTCSVDNIYIRNTIMHINETYP